MSRKFDDEELGVLLTREMLSMMSDKTLSYENRAKLFCAIVYGEKLKEGVLASFANSLKTGFERINNKRKAAIYSRRERQKIYAKEKYASTKADEDKPLSTQIDKDERASLGNAKHCIAKQYNIPPKPPKGGGVESDNSVQERNAAEEAAAWLEETAAFSRMRANRRSLMRILIPLAKKNGARLGEWRGEIEKGLAAWQAAWESNDWQYAPGKITKWLSDEKYLEIPRGGAKNEESAGCGECGAEIV